MFLHHHFQDFVCRVFCIQGCFSFGEAHSLFVGDQVEVVGPFEFLAGGLFEKVFVKFFHSYQLDLSESYP